ncbi:MAG: 3-isopropylmalate dehydratase small subunit [Frankiales bacterium]|nr:3-isopropylmalate dehydratase small subunit [Frankiales bacterium]
MDAFVSHTGRAVPLRRSDVDTDQIIPSDWLKRVARTGFGAGLFSEWRADPGFVLNDARYAGASILLAGENFGTGSSREHAVWALTDFGFRAVVSARFADIFRSNALKGGLLPVQLPAEVVTGLMARVEADPSLQITVDLDARELRAGDLTACFPLDDFTRWRLMEGLDDIGLTLRRESDIAAYEALRPAHLPTTAAAR